MSKEDGTKIDASAVSKIAWGYVRCGDSVTVYHAGGETTHMSADEHEKLEIEERHKKLGPPDPIVISLWNDDAGKRATDHSLPPLKYYCPKCMSDMTKHDALDWARDGKEIIVGYHVYMRGIGQAWDCGPLKMYDPQTDVVKNLLAHHCVYKGIPVESEEHLAELKAKEDRGQKIP